MNAQEQAQLSERISSELSAREDVEGFEIVVSEHAANVYYRGTAKPSDVFAALNFNTKIQRPKSCTLKVHKRKARS